MIRDGKLTLRWDGSKNWILEETRAPSTRTKPSNKEEVTVILGYYSELESAARRMLRVRLADIGGATVIWDFLKYIEDAEARITAAVQASTEPPLVVS